jgi:hypothetical protein
MGWRRYPANHANYGSESGRGLDVYFRKLRRDMLIHHDFIYDIEALSWTVHRIRCPKKLCVVRHSLHYVCIGNRRE